MLMTLNRGIIIFFLVLSAAFGEGKNRPKYPAPLDTLLFYQSSHPSKALKIGIEVLNNPHDLTDNVVATIEGQIGVILKNQGFIVQAMDFLQKSMNHYIEKGDSSLLGWYYIEVGNIYFYEKMYPKAKKQYFKAIDAFKQNSNLHGQATGINNLALIAIEEENFDEAFTLFNDALEIRIDFGKEPYLLGHSYKYIGDLYFQLGQKTLAKEYYDKVLSLGILEGEGNIKGLTHQALMEIYFETGYKDKAIEHYKLAEHNYTIKNDSKYLAELYRYLAVYFKKNANPKEALNYYRKMMKVSEKQGFIKYNIEALENIISIHEIHDPSLKLNSLFHQLNGLQKKLYFNEISKSIEQSEMRSVLSFQKMALSEKETKLFRATVIIIFGTVGGLFLVVLVWSQYRYYLYKKKSNAIALENQKEIYEKKIKIEEMKESQLEEELVMKKRDLITKTTYLQQKNDIIAKIGNDLEYHISLMAGAQDKRRFRSLMARIKELDNTEDQWQEFEKHFIEVFHSFLQDLSQKFSNLSAQDLKICAYIKMNLITKDISRLTGLAVRSVETRRYRLRKKMGIPEGETILFFLNNI